MSKNELPPTAGDGGRSVFSVFGFGSNRHPHDEFESPLESTPESFDATVYQKNSVSAVNTRGAHGGQAGKPLTPNTALKSSTENSHIYGSHSPRIPRPMWAFIPASRHTRARKMRVNLPDNSGPVLQSFCQGNGKHSSGHSQGGDDGQQERYHGTARRYSTPQEDAEEHVNSQETLRKFNESMIKSSAYVYSTHGGANTGFYNNLVQYSQDNLNKPSSSSSTAGGLMTRVQSSPHLLNAGHMSVSKYDIESSVDVDSSPSQASLRRRQSYGDVLSMDIKRAGINEESPQGQEDMSVSKMSSNPVSSTETHKVTWTDVMDSNTSSQSGLGILSRTRQFGSWLTKATEGEKVEVTKKDLNVFAPNSF